MASDENKLVCKKCETINSETACFCQNCGKPLNEKGTAKQYGWKTVFYDMMLPGLGHYKIGRKVEAYVLMTVFLFSFTLYSIDCASIAMKVINNDAFEATSLTSGGLQKSIDSRKTLYNSFLSWTYIVTWFSAVINSIVIRMEFIKKEKEG